QNEGADTGFLSEPSAVADGLKLNNQDANVYPPATAGGSDLSAGVDLSGQQALFGIVQGAGHLPLRKESLDRTVEIGFDGYAIGGLSVGEEKSVMYEVLEF